MPATGIDATTPQHVRDQMALARPLHPHGLVSRCPTCNKKTMTWRHDLLYRAPTREGLHTIHDISGGECKACGEVLYDPAGLHRIDQALRGQDHASDTV